MLEGKALIEDTDMPMKMQIQAMASACQALDLYDVLDCESLAAHIKKQKPSIFSSSKVPLQGLIAKDVRCIYIGKRIR